MWQTRKRRYVMPLGRPICRWEDNVPTDLTEKGWEGTVGFI